MGEFFQQTNIMRLYLNALGSPDHKLIVNSLENIYLILELGEKAKGDNGENAMATSVATLGGLNFMDSLQMHPNKEVAEAAARIVHDFFKS
jgi:hypothetical protein